MKSQYASHHHAKIMSVYYVENEEIEEIENAFTPTFALKSTFQKRSKKVFPIAEVGKLTS